MLRAKVPHIEPNEADIAYYARLEKISGEKNNIYCLCDDNGILKEGTENVIKIVHDFYSTLYRKETECCVSQDKFLDKVTISLSDEDKADLDRDITLDELEKSLSQLKKKKKSGL